ncbi:hypothetical protein C8R43DRAFT_1135834 [Mycena crocata]|nr:hypothetical protein C8R43DRAFT_1135834 [Mycena crocata]
MRLILSTIKPINATYRDETRVVQYKVRTPIKVHDLTTTITLRIDSDIPRRQQGGDSDSESESDRFGLLAEVSWRMVGPKVIRFGGEEFSPESFFRKENSKWYWPGQHIFTAKDGKEYKWSMTRYTTKLTVNDGSDTIAAEYRAKSLGLISKARDPCLEIFPDFEYMADEIMMTFIYVEKTRQTHIDGSTQL